jgi:aconitate hydratase
LQFKDKESPEKLGLTGKEIYDIEDLEKGAREVSVVARGDGGKPMRFRARVRIDTPKEWEYYLNGGILHYVIRQLAA